jgi:DNA-binding beta-propeller fold protein YncE
VAGSRDPDRLTSDSNRRVELRVKLQGASKRAATVAATVLLTALYAAAPALAVDDHTLYLGGAFPADVLPGDSAGPGLAGINIRDGGSLGSIGGSPFGPPGVAAEQVAITPDGKYVYGSSAGSQRVLAFSTGEGGRLTSIPGITFTGVGDPDPSSIAIAPDGGHAYVADPGPEGVRVLSIGTDGALVEQEVAPVAGADNTFGVAIAPDGKFVYATASNFPFPSRIYGFSVDPDGGLTGLPGSGSTISTGLATITLTPDGNHLYTASEDGAVNGFSVASDGSLSATFGSPYGSGFSGSLVASPTEQRIYATRSDTPGPSGVAVFSVAASGALSQIAGSPFAASNLTDTIAVTPSDKFVYAAGGNATNRISGFDVGATGALSINTGAGIFPGPYLQRAGSSAISPNQPPVASVAIARGSGKGVVDLDGSGSFDIDGSVDSYAWDYGDGGSASGVVTTHAYAPGQIYSASLTTTDAEGCSTSFVFTGQTASCNGSGVARDSFEVDLVPPQLTISAERKQELGKAVKVKASCDDVCAVVGSGKVRAKPADALKRSLKLKRITDAVSTTPKAIRLKLSRRSKKAARKALRGGATLTARIKFEPSESLIDGKAVKRKIKIRR